jgi:hypothetical protein
VMIAVSVTFGAVTFARWIIQVREAAHTRRRSRAVRPRSSAAARAVRGSAPGCALTRTRPAAAPCRAGCGATHAEAQAGLRGL